MTKKKVVQISGENLPKLNVTEIGLTADSKTPFIDSSLGKIELSTKVDMDILQSNLRGVAYELKASTKNNNNAISFGAIGDNTSDNFTFINNMFKDTVSQTIYDPTISSNQFITKSITIPQGVYRIKQPNLFLSTLSARSQNLVIDGNGATFVFEGFEGYCFVNNDKLLNVDFYNLNFISLNDATGTNRSLFKSISSGGAQGFRFHQCNFSGKYKYGIDLQGSNTNSEWVFNQCGLFGIWESFLYIGSTTSSDQFLNYWFNNCRYWSSSNWITAYKGGHFKLNHCDVSGYSPTTDTFLFKLMGGPHAYGVTSFIDDGTRYELKTTFAKVIYCEWDSARISFENSDMGSNTFNAIERLGVFYFKNSTSGNSSNYSFINCVLLGRFILSSGNIATRNYLNITDCLLLGDGTATTLDSLFTYIIGVNQYEKFGVVLTNTKFKDNLITQNMGALVRPYSPMIQKSTLIQSPWSTLLADWKFPVNQPTFIDEVIVQNLYKRDGHTYNFVVKSDISRVSAVLTTNTFSIQISDNTNSLYIGSKLTIGNSDIIYTIISQDYRSEFFLVLDKKIESTVTIGDIISIYFTEITFTPNSYLKSVVCNAKTVIINPLYIKVIGQAFPVVGVSARILVKTIE